MYTSKSFVWIQHCLEFLLWAEWDIDSDSFHSNINNHSADNNTNKIAFEDKFLATPLPKAPDSQQYMNHSNINIH